MEETSLRDLLGTTDRGTTVTNILMLNASLPSLKAELHQWLLVDLQEYLETKLQPCIVTVGTRALPHWNEADNLHAVIVHGFDDVHIFINDPYFDDREFPVPIEAFLAAWSETENFAITIERR
ncbi:MAG: cysteine peptidase family C39 domain-containing protein [candidate division KSB1 bacterium]|nr:cysteine peptidase family C39 domain-containing protein [candidate division KSB1 bacterium]MDZ7368450.1 cysteine peptidase family C39 domain-containing protein [candidate division KSB1 bacterium]MDZ7406176.1 cysteine peptidase family C39 domain-containing protein [candidate division KSB1 bacterium]